MISIILAAGKGTRMKSKISKVMHKVNGVPMIKKIVNVLDNSGTNKNFLILGHLKEQIIDELQNVEYIVQEEQLGTAHAIMISEDIIKKSNEDVLITYGDGPLITEDTIKSIYKKFKDDNLDCILLSCNLTDPYGYGRIIKEKNKVIDIVEEIDTTEEQKKIKEVNIGLYIVKNKSLLSIIKEFDNNNSKGEYYLTDIVKLMNNKGYNVDSFTITDETEIMGVNSKEQLSIASEILRNRKNKKLMDDGVVLIDPKTTYIEENVKIGIDTVIYPNTYIQGKTEIGESCTIYSNTRIVDSVIKNNVVIDSSLIEESLVENNVTIGPFAHLRPLTHLKEKVKIGNFVEIKKSTLEEGVKCGHLTYIGDTLIGSNTNIGAGTITCNYDGKKKHQSIIEEDAFIGSNTIIISPIKIGKGAMTAAGSVITKDVPDESLAFGRAKQCIKNKKNKITKESE